VALQLKLEERGPLRIADWVLPTRMHFMYSEAFRVFARSLANYVGGDIPGRCFLIAGNRGAGKTTLVLRAVGEYYEAALRRLVEAAAAQDIAALQARRVARPLLVKLHGPSLLADELPRPGGGERPKSDNVMAPWCTWRSNCIERSPTNSPNVLPGR
jgi:hypothetical protein